MTTWTNTSKNSSSFSNQSKNTSVFSNVSRNTSSFSNSSKNSSIFSNQSKTTDFLDFLLLETGLEILTESGLFIVLEQSTTGQQTAWNNQPIS